MPAKRGSFLGRLITSIISFLTGVGITIAIGFGVAGIAQGIAPNLGVSILGPILCPADTTPTLITEYGPIYRDSDGDQRQEAKQKIRCVDAQGAISIGPGEQYQLYWYGLWAGVMLILAALAVAVWLVLKLISRLRRASLPPAPAQNTP